MDLESIPIVGRFVVLLGGVADLFLHSGEFVFLLIDVALSNIHILATVLKTLETLAERIPGLPAGLFETLFTAALVALLVIELGRLGEALLSKS